MFRVKICGIRRPDDAIWAASLGADALGFNFFRQSKRFIDPAAAARISVILPLNICRVGVFVNASATEICETCKDAGLNAVQLHGSEPVELLLDLPKLPIVKAFALRSVETIDQIKAYVATAANQRTPLAAVLCDAFLPGEFGGTGKTPDWGVAAELRKSLAPLPLILAGGLTPENVGRAIATVYPAGVDTASGVEQAPGVKDAERMRSFVEAAKSAIGAVPLPRDL